MTEYAHPETLVDTSWLSEHAKDPTVRVFEVDVDTSSHEQGHVAGAIGVNWKSDLQQQPVRDLLDKRQLEEFLSKNGVTKDTTIVVYGDNNNWFAAWFFWLLKYYGHKDVRLVNGGRAKWVAEGKPLTSERPTFQRSEYRAQAPDASVRALRDYVLERVTANGAKILGVAQSLGTVETGKRADLVVLHGDLTADPSVIRSPTIVFKDGVGYDSAKLIASVQGRVGVN